MLSEIILEDLHEIAGSLKKESRALEGKTILITGGSGFLGKYFLNTFWYLNENVFSKKCKVISIDNFITGTESDKYLLEDNNFKFIKHDVKEPLNIDGQVDYVIHAAGIASPVYYMKYPLETIEVATTGTKNLLEFAKNKKVKSFVFFSSSEIYGDPDPNFVPTPESYPGNVSSTGPRSCYDESKRLGETLCMVYFRLYNMPVKIVRPFNVYGPGMRTDDFRVIPRFLTSALKNVSLPVHAGGNQTRTFCYIADSIVGFLKVMLSDKNGETYNVGNADNEINMMMLANYVVNLFPNKKIGVQTVDYPKTYPQDDPRRRCPDLTKIYSLGYHPKIDLKTGLKKTLNWYKEQFRSKNF